MARRIERPSGDPVPIPCRMRDVSSPYIVAVGGTLRPGSSTEKAMQHVLKAAERAGARTRLISGPALQLPMYQPENPDRSEAARDLVAQLALADGIILGSPGYHGSISGLIKNALDYAEDLPHFPQMSGMITREFRPGGQARKVRSGTPSRSRV